MKTNIYHISLLAWFTEVNMPVQGMMTVEAADEDRAQQAAVLYAANYLEEGRPNPEMEYKIQNCTPEGSKHVDYDIPLERVDSADWFLTGL